MKVALFLPSPGRPGSASFSWGEVLLFFPLETFTALLGWVLVLTCLKNYIFQNSEQQALLSTA